MSELDRIADTLLQYIVESNGIEVYRIGSNIALRWPYDLEQELGAEKTERALRVLIADMYIEAAKEVMEGYEWVEGFSSVEDDLQIRTDYPVLDIANRVVPNPEAAERRLKDLQDIQQFVNRMFRVTKSSMQVPKFYEHFLRVTGFVE